MKSAVGRAINRRFLDQAAAAYPGDAGKIQRLSIVEESTPKQVRMANLAMVGSHSINGVSQIHSELVKTSLAPDFFQQVKRIHAYKRQLLNVMHIIDEYLLLIEDGRQPRVPRTYIFAGKAAPGYWLAKQVIKLIHNVGRVINNDARASQWIKVVFIPDYRVSLAEKIIPAADLSEQISTAGTEASGTGNMKLALNGALTTGTLDGANIEILEEVGEDNLFIFGLKAAEVLSMRGRRSYRPWEYYARNPRLKRVADSFSSNLFYPDEPDLFKWILACILDANDEHFHLADLGPYAEAQERAGNKFLDRKSWTKMSILNVARMGKFSSDRTVGEYARDIWSTGSGSASDIRRLRS